MIPISAPTLTALGVTGMYPGIGDTSHTVDSQRGIDFLVFQFDKSVTVDLAKFTVLSVGGVGDSDATIGFGNTDVPFSGALDLNTWSQITTLFTPFADNLGGSSNATRDINPTDASGNLLFIGAGPVQRAQQDRQLQDRHPDGYAGRAGAGELGADDLGLRPRRRRDAPPQRAGCLRLGIKAFRI